MFERRGSLCKSPLSKDDHEDPQGEWLKHIFTMADIDKNGRLNFPEFVAVRLELRSTHRVFRNVMANLCTLCIACDAFVCQCSLLSSLLTTYWVGLEGRWAPKKPLSSYGKGGQWCSLRSLRTDKWL